MAGANKTGNVAKIVAAINIGLPFSGYAYSRSTTFNRNPLLIQQKERWFTDNNSITQSITCLLVNETLELVAFGYDALELYEQLKQNGKHKEYFLFRNYHLQLYKTKEPLMNVQISDVDEHGKVSAKHVLALSILSLKNELIQQLDIGDGIVNESEILWVLPNCVGSIDDSHFFMTECAKQAGISTEQLMVVYEHEAAFVYSQYIETKNSSSDCEKIGFEKPGVEYVMVELKGEVIQTMVLRKTDHKKIMLRHEKKEVRISNINTDLVDSEFWEVLINIFGHQVLNKIREDKPNSYIKLFRNFNKVKTAKIENSMENPQLNTTGAIGSQNFVSITFPCKIFNEMLQRFSRKRLEQSLQSSSYCDAIKANLSNDKLLINSDVIKSCFGSTTENVVNSLQSVFESNSTINIKYIILVGHLSESIILQKAVQLKFPTKSVFVPTDGSNAILKGAVLLGHAPSVIGLDSVRNVTTDRTHYLGVVAIDFGTAFSGYAYSTVDKYKNLPLSMTVKKWPEREIEHKTSTSVLLDEHKRLLSFGSEAQDYYARLKPEERKSYYYYENFKMNLYNNQVRLSKLRLMDIQNKPDRSLLAHDVFSAAIKYLKDDALKELKKQGTKVTVDEIRWVVTVPAIWPEHAKLFMRESAKQAGIDSEKLLIALEPEAASVYTQFQETKKSGKGGFNAAAPGTKYMVVDVGGGTTDITVHEKLPNGKLKELNKASGDGCGGKAVDRKFFELLDNMFGIDNMKKFKTEYPTYYLDLQRKFEDEKRTVNSETTSNKHIWFPCSSFNEIMGSSENFDHYCKQNSIDLVDGKLVLSHETLESLFQPTIKSILDNIEHALNSRHLANVSMIMLVGGFAKSKLLQTFVRNKFEGKLIIVPEDAGLSVLKGAVLYGHNPETIDPRVTRFTYGAEISSPFQVGTHEPSRLIRDEIGNFYCRGTFNVIIKQNTTVKLGTVIKKTYTVPPYTTSVDVEIYAAHKDEPLYTDDPCCRKIGTLVISIPIPSEETRHVDVEYIFGNTEIGVRAKETKYKKEASAILTFD